MKTWLPLRGTRTTRGCARKARAARRLMGAASGKSRRRGMCGDLQKTAEDEVISTGHGRRSGANGEGELVEWRLRRE
jgi:hypothetical protein